MGLLPQKLEALGLQLVDDVSIGFVEFPEIAAWAAIRNSVPHGEVTDPLAPHGLSDRVGMVVERFLVLLSESAKMHGLESFVEANDPKLPTLPIDRVAEQKEVKAESGLDDHRPRLGACSNEGRRHSQSEGELLRWDPCWGSEMARSSPQSRTLYKLAAPHAQNCAYCSDV